MAKYDKHELITAVRDLAIELGRTPKRTEFFAVVKNAQPKLEALFGRYTDLVMAAGLEPNYNKKERPLGNEIFERDLSKVLEEYKPAEVLPPVKYTPTLVIGDTHFPFVSVRVLERIYEFAEKHKPQRVIQVGDLYDLYAHSKFPRSHNVYQPKEEEELARKGAQEMWATLRRIVPEAECVQLKGNHDVRPLKRTLEVQPSVEHIVEKHLNEMMTFEGVTLIADPRQEYIVEGIEFIHGHTRFGAHRDYALMNAVCGHLHKGGVVYRRIRGQTLWELNAGLVGDPESKALAYTAQKIYDATPGFGFIDEYGPRFVAL